MERLPNMRNNSLIRLNGSEFRLSELNIELLKILATSKDGDVSVSELTHAWDKFGRNPTNIKNVLAKLNHALSTATEIANPIIKNRVEHPLHTNRPVITYKLNPDITVSFMDKEVR